MQAFRYHSLRMRVTVTAIERDLRSLLAGDVEFAHVTKKWAGIGKELFTSADNYVLQISDAVPGDNVVRQLILAAVLCIDMVLKE